MALADVLQVLREQPLLHDLHLEQLTTFIRLAAHLKRDILLPQPLAQTTDSAPDVLPEAVVIFLSLAIGIPLLAVEPLWDLLKDDVWDSPPIRGLVSEEDEDLYRLYGWQVGLTALTLYPPSQMCTNPGCSREIPLKKEQQRQVVCYTIGRGVRPAWSIHLFCPDCNTNYHHNYSVHQGMRTYYENVPDYIQVGEHQFVQRKLVEMWVGLMVLGWFSATNASRLYDMTLAEKANLESAGWQFGGKLTTDHVWDGFLILSLLEDHLQHHSQLQVPHTGSQHNRCRD